MIMFEKNFAKLHFPIKKIFFEKDELSKNHEKKKSLKTRRFCPLSFRHPLSLFCPVVKLTKNERGSLFTRLESGCKVHVDIS